MPANARTTARHADWLGLVEPLGPFLTLPVLRRAMPEGLERTRAELRSALRERVDALGREFGARREFTGWVLRTLLAFGEQVREGQAIPEAFVAVEPVQHTSLRPDFAVLDRQEPSRPRLLVSVYPAGTNLAAHLAGERWAASPIDRMVALCRGVDCRLGLVTDGDRFTLVWAPASGPVGRATWVASVFAEGSERNLLDSFTTLLGAKRFFAAAKENQLEALLAESANAQADVTGQLGLQVRRATELLVAAFSRADRERGGDLLAGITPHTVYEAAATVLMRLVFLLYAEERRLLPLGDELYDASYAASTLREGLRATADRIGEDALEHHVTAWPRLLALFRAVYGGLAHDRLSIPAYGGRLFDPDRYPFLEGRKAGESWREVASDPIPVDDRALLGILTALQIIETRAGGVSEARRLSFRALGVEQIGHVYEGLLDHSAVAITRPTLGLVGRTPGAEPEIALDDLEAQARQGQLADWLPERTGKSKSYIERALEEEADDDRRRLMLVACDNDPQLASRVEPYAALVREDLRGIPIVLPRGSLYVTETSHRRDTGTEYTPRELADEVVRYTLEPLVYDPGPQNETEPAKWTLKPADAILDLRVCDPAVGSGAFLVAACRYLADRVVEAWTLEGNQLVAELSAQVPPEGEVDDLTIEARRRVAERCLFGVDRDPMAVEMAKLSLWLTTMARERPFSFLDHALQSGDSLLGITSIEQVLRFHMDPTHQKQLPLAGTIIPAVEEAIALRRRLGATPVRDHREAEEKARLLREAEQVVEPIKIVADLVIGAALSTALPGHGSFDEQLARVEPPVIAAFDPKAASDARRARLGELAARADAWLNAGRPDGAPPRHCLHWPLAFPEVFDRRGAFDAIVGNPPFLGGKRISGLFGNDFREYCFRYVANETKGNADLVAYFLLRASTLSSYFGLLSTNTVSQGDTREVGLDQCFERGWRIYRATKSEPWPGYATLEIAKLWATKRVWGGAFRIRGVVVAGITSGINAETRTEGLPERLAENDGNAFIGSLLNGIGFVLDNAEAQALVRKDPANADVILPYQNGEDLTRSSTQAPSRWAIYFRDWSLDAAARYPDCLAVVRERVKPHRDTLKAYKQRVRTNWWLYEYTGLSLYAAIEKLPRVAVLTRVSKTVMPVFVTPNRIFSEQVVVFAYDDDFHFGFLSSAFHWHWTVKYASTLETRIRYTPSDVFETFPQPRFSDSVAAAGKTLHDHRAALMVKNDEGLTKTYNRVHDAADTSPGIIELRELHRRLDLAVRDAYEWSDLELDHGFHETSQGARFTIGPATRTEVLDRMLELNHARYADEVARGLHAGRKKGKAKARAKAAQVETAQGGLFEGEARGGRR